MALSLFKIKTYCIQPLKRAMSSEENFIKLDDIPTEVWVTLGVLGGVLLSYCLCMRQGYQDNWIGNVPPGPHHLPFIGNMLYML